MDLLQSSGTGHRGDWGLGHLSVKDRLRELKTQRDLIHMHEDFGNSTSIYDETAYLFAFKLLRNGKAPNRLLREAVESPALETIKTRVYNLV